MFTLIILLLTWLLFSGYFKAFFLISGLISSCIIVVMLRYQKIPVYNLSFRSIKYVLWLFYQMILSSWSVTKLVWKRHLNIAPQIKKISHHQKSNYKIVILANSITLTPGTLTINEEEGCLYVHTLMEEYLEGVDDIKKQVAKFVDK